MYACLPKLIDQDRKRIDFGHRLCERRILRKLEYLRMHHKINFAPWFSNRIVEIRKKIDMILRSYEKLINDF